MSVHPPAQAQPFLALDCMASDEDIVFLGRDGSECEEFIRAIHKVAYAAGKIRDDAWMADLASTCFSGRALRYYLGLEPGVQCNWRLLCHTLLTKYPRPDEDEEELQHDESRTLRTSAEGLSPPFQARTGRIKVIGADFSDFGYLGDGATVTSSVLGAGASATEAITVCYIPGAKLFEIEIKCPDNTPQLLGGHWDSQSPSTAIGSLNYAALTSFNYEGSRRSSTMTWAGPGHTRLWEVTRDNILCPHVEDDARRAPMQFFMLRQSGYQRHSIDFAADAGAFMTKFGPSGWTLVKLLFEPLS